MHAMLIAEAQPRARAGWRQFIADSFPGNVQTAASLSRLLWHLERTRWDLLLVNVRFPAIDPRDFWAEIGRRHSNGRWLAVGDLADERFIQAYVEAGASGYLTCSDGVEVWRHAVERALRGGRYLSPRIANAVSREADTYRHLELRKRDQQVLFRLAAGADVNQIAREFGIKASTVNCYRARLFRKMGFASVHDAVQYAKGCSLEAS